MVVWVGSVRLKLTFSPGKLYANFGKFEFLSRLFMYISLRCNTSFFFISNAFFSTQPQCCLTFSWIELQKLIRCWLIHVSVVITRHFYLADLCSCLGFGLFVLFFCNLFSIFIFIFIINIRIAILKQTHLFICILFRICPIIFGW